MIFLPAVFLSVLSVSAISLSSVMEPYEKQHCFYIDVTDPKNPLSFYYSESVTKFSKASQGSSPVKLQIFGPSQELLQDHPPKPVLETKLQPTSIGKHSFCLSFTERPSRKVLDVDLTEHTVDAKQNASGGLALQPAGEKETDALAMKLERTNQKLRSDLEDLSHTLKYVKNREKRNMETVEEANSRVWWFSMLASVLVVGMAIFQVTILKQLFGTGSRPRV